MQCNYLYMAFRPIYLGINILLFLCHIFCKIFLVSLFVMIGITVCKFVRNSEVVMSQDLFQLLQLALNIDYKIYITYIYKSYTFQKNLELEIKIT